MIIVDTALAAREAEGRPVRVGMLGAGFMARGIANQILNYSTGIRLAAIYNRHAPRAIDCFRYADTSLEPLTADSQSALDDAIVLGRPVVTEDEMAVCRSPHIDVVLDVTGAVEFGARAALEAFAYGKHVILMNAELDATLGPILQIHAKRHGVILSACDGDQPAVEVNLYRFVKGMGLIPRVMGNIKGLQDPVSDSDDAEGICGEVGPAALDGDELRGWLEGELRAGGRRERHGHDRGTARPSRLRAPWPRGRARDEVRRRAASQPRRDRRVRRWRAAGPGHLLPRRAHGSAATSLSQSLQARRRSAVQLLHAVPPVPLRGPEHDRACGVARRCRGARRSEARASKCARWPSATSDRESRSTTTDTS